MEIDLDNLVFSGLEEAQERNAERLEEADKKAQAVVADDDCASPPGDARGQRHHRGNQKDKADRETGWNNAGGIGGNILPGVQFR